MNRYDYIIIGAGAAGLSLALAIYESKELVGKTVLLVDNDLIGGINKTWCYWASKPLIKEANEASWFNMRYSNGGTTKVSSISDKAYHCTFSHTFRSFVLKTLQSAPQYFYIEEARVERVDVGEKGSAVILSNGQTAKGSYVFDSRLDKEGFDTAQMYQSFFGYFVEKKGIATEPATFTLMDFSQTNEGNAFLYVLPFSEDKVLIEYTVVDHHPIDRESLQVSINQLLSEHYKGALVEREEYGCIPLFSNERSSGSHLSTSYVKIGTTAGVTKPSTGYTFSFIQKHTAQIVEGLIKGENGRLHYRKSDRHRFYDTVLLEMLKKNPNYLSSFTSKLFKADFRSIIRFLNEETSLIQDTKLFTKLPWLPFIRQSLVLLFG